MRNRDVILDFTSLLDVTLIIIFFFVIFSHFDEQENKARTDAKVQELQEAVQEAEQREMEAEELKNQLENEIQIVQESDERQAWNVVEMLEFNRSGNIKMILDMNDGSWSVRIVKGDEVVTTVQGKDDIGEALMEALEKTGYDDTKTIFCDFVFDGSLPGTASAYRKISKGIQDTAKEYKYFYTSETDLSVGGE